MKNILFLILNCVSILASAQSGVPWGMTGMDIADNSHDNMQPRVAVDGSGNPLVIWGRMSKFLVHNKFLYLRYLLLK